MTYGERETNQRPQAPKKHLQLVYKPQWEEGGGETRRGWKLENGQNVLTCICVGLYNVIKGDLIIKCNSQCMWKIISPSVIRRKPASHKIVRWVIPVICCQICFQYTQSIAADVFPLELQKATQLAESIGRVWLLLSLRQVCEHRAYWQLKHLASRLLSKSSECWGEHGFTNHPFRSRDRNWQVGRAAVSGVKITLKCGAQREAEWVSLWMVKATGVTVYYVHVGNQTSVFWRWVNTFCPSVKRKIFDVDCFRCCEQTKKIVVVHIMILYLCKHKWSDDSSQEDNTIVSFS